METGEELGGGETRLEEHREVKEPGAQWVGSAGRGREEEKIKGVPGKRKTWGGESRRVYRGRKSGGGEQRGGGEGVWRGAEGGGGGGESAAR